MKKKKDLEIKQFFNDANHTSKETKGNKIKNSEAENEERETEDSKSKKGNKKPLVLQLDNKDRAILKKYVMEVWVPSTLVYVGLVVPFLPPYVAMIVYEEYFLPSWTDDPLDELRTTSWFFFMTGLGIGKLACQYRFHTLWKNVGCGLTWLNILVVHAGIIIPIGMSLFLIYESARCKISSVISQINTTTYQD